MKHLICQVFFLILEVLMNIISLIILPKPVQFKSDYFIKLYHRHNKDFKALEEELSSPKRTSAAIIAFFCLICIMHIYKVAVFIEFASEHRCSNESKDSIYSSIEYINVPFLFINWSMAISMIPKMSKIIDEYPFDFLEEFKSRIIGIVVLYSLSYLFIICQYLVTKKCLDDCCKNISPISQVYIPSPSTNNNNYQNNFRSTTSRNNINTNQEQVEVRVTNTNNHIILLFNILPKEVYENLKSFIEQGKEKTIKLIAFYLEMRFVGLTTEESISNEIAGIVVGVAKILSDVFDDRVAKACLELGTEDYIMLLMHYAFPFIILVIKLKIEKGIYRRSVDIAHVNVIQMLTQVQRRIELDEQGNIRISFRINRRINQNSFVGLLNP